ncbi:nitroreductase [Mycobacterium kubicae]|uniref:Nitroreductase n=1 Tax=Mycobacterium kubicae TaxID=120959 RepID=A0AAX1J9B6_9MYCO|nr:nitroreductase/quinone reductase family protein [Mycobacterium kubicae]MCV7095199.1 nitroreductase family deazaflavin-dependent oxidoreductase [Mycobacterium kubicae]OBF15492.1 nitroreductase [Mycobacterium kubicae]OBK53867.1 nitroreductase [Mycobacterium kubicae]ORV95106.1 nitroreductase [Mycobacterium kubicae]QNI08983.1 nitroreductase family deazaflavin-dependent oxidoreductase [Mycobacterium kubicae]
MPLRYVDPERRTTPLSRLGSGFARSRVGQLFAKHVAARTDPVLSRISNGKLNWGALVAPSATLRMNGAKTGEPRETQLAYFHQGRDVIVVASNFGEDHNPQWYHNLVANPDCELGGEPFHATEVEDPDEYQRLYQLAERSYGGYRDYRGKTAEQGRRIPILKLTPTA